MCRPTQVAKVLMFHLWLQNLIAVRQKSFDFKVNIILYCNSFLRGSYFLVTITATFITIVNLVYESLGIKLFELFISFELENHSILHIVAYFSSEPYPSESLAHTGL